MISRSLVKLQTVPFSVCVSKCFWLCVGRFAGSVSTNKLVICRQRLKSLLLHMSVMFQ